MTHQYEVSLICPMHCFFRPGLPFETVLFQKKSYKAVSQVIDTATSILGHLSKTKTI